MGQTLIDAVLAAPDLTLTGALEISGSALLGRDVGERSGRATGVAITADPAAGVRNADVLIDFTRPEGTLAHLAACAAAKVGAVVGTTGLSASDKEAMRELARGIPIVFAPNMSVGVNVLRDGALARRGSGHGIGPRSRVGGRLRSPRRHRRAPGTRHRLRKLARGRRRRRSHGHFRGRWRAHRAHPSGRIAGELCARCLARGALCRAQAQGASPVRHAGRPGFALSGLG